MANSYFRFKQFTIQQDRCAMKVTTDACLFGSMLSSMISKQEVLKVLDIGTGTGLLSLMLAQKHPDISVDAIELDEEAFKQASENVTNSPWSKRINVVHADARNYNAWQQYDIIISNPPFYANELKSENQHKNIAHHSEELTFTDLFNSIDQNIKPSGSFYLLLPYKRYAEIRNFLSKNDFALLKVILVKQSVNHNFFRVIVEGRKKTNETHEIAFDEISIWDGQQQYTVEFVSLLKDYYLYL